MIGAQRVLAIVPARGGSKGLPRKNVRLLAGKPLVAWPVQAALQASCVDRVIISTDDVEIAEAARAAGADVPFMRPTDLANDTASSMDVVRHAIQVLASEGDQYDYVVLLEPTSPLTESSDIDAALNRLHASRGIADAIVGISQVEATHPEYDVTLSQDGLIAPYSASSFSSLKRRQEIARLFFLEGSVYISGVEAFLEKGSFYHDRTLGYQVPRWKAFEVDELVDLICIEAIMNHREELSRLE